MNIQFASDLHLEFRENKEYILQNPLKPSAEILILTGDVMPFFLIEKHADFLNYCADHFKQTYWLPGNHEYYGSDIAQRSGSFIEHIRPNVHLLNNHAVAIQNCLFVFSTLWSKVSTANIWYVQQNLNDYHSILRNKKPFTVTDSNALHNEGLSFIRKKLKTNTLSKALVATHHVPTMMHYPEQYKGDTLNEAFATELYIEIENLKPDYWLYGHHHTNTPNFNIGKTMLQTNQLGYVKYGEHRTFENTKILSL